MEIPSWMTKDDAKINIESDLLVIITKYGGKHIIAGEDMDSLLKDLYEYVMSERVHFFRDHILK